jgi:hypothetical protein
MMHEYQDTEILEFVHTSSPATSVPAFQKLTGFQTEPLVVFLETLVVFSPYYLAADPRT